MTDSNILDKIRKLLALAEGAGTTAEADTASAAAERLIAKYAVDLALLQDQRGNKGAPTTLTLQVPDPYAVAKAHLANAVAGAYGCKAIYQARNNAMVVVGYQGDLESVELLFTSLLLQATSAGMRAVAPDPRRVRSFRNAFLLGFAGTVDQRLRAARREAVDTTPGAALVLRDRSSEVDAAYRELFPHTRSSSASSSNRAGASAGSAAARTADLGQTRFAGSRRAVSA